MESCDDDSLSLGSPPALTSSSPSLDCRGVLRGKCSACNCPNFQKRLDNSGFSCAVCGHPPVKHINLSASTSSSSLNSLPSQQEDMSFEFSSVHSFIEENEEEESEEEECSDDDIQVDGRHVCAVLDCGRETNFDINTGISEKYCRKHLRGHIRSAPYSSFPNSRFFNRGTTHIQHTPRLHHNRAVPFQKGASLATPFTSRGRPPTYFQSIPSFSQPSLDSESMTVSVSLCKLPGCKKPAYFDPETNQMFDCCSRFHGRQYMDMMADDTTIDPAMKCSNPDCSRPKYQEEDGTVHDFCGRSCRDQFKAKKVKAIPQATLENMCMLPGCTKPCYTDPRTGTTLSFCGQSHAKQATMQIFLELPLKSDEYDKVLKHFDKFWVKNRPPPLPVLAIMKINNDRVKSTFRNYKDSISSKREWHFHGTSLSCNLLANKSPCTNNKCGVCGIARRGFDHQLIGTNIPRLKRFGHGFYLAPNSSKCHDYTQGHKTYRAMILCDVAPGNKHIVKNNQETLKGPPSGCHSVYGSSGGALNYDEIVLYSSAAICPLYVIFYTKDKIGKIAQ